jgi:hypothetical protein
MTNKNDLDSNNSSNKKKREDVDDAAYSAVCMMG